MNKPRLTVARAKQALLANHGVVHKSAISLGCARTTLSTFINSHPELREVREFALETILDVAESNFYTATEQGDLYASKLVLERKGRHRGWGPSPVISNQVTVPFIAVLRIPAGRLADYIDGEAVEVEQLTNGHDAADE